MNKLNRISAAVLAGLALLSAPGASHGLGYGRPSSRAILGETLTVSVPVRIEASDDVANECVAADVYFGDDKLAATEVQAVLMPGAGSERVIRVTTRKIIDEPVVTIYLAAGCTSKINRKFVAFADPPDAVAPSVSLDVTPPKPVAYSAQPGKVSVGGVSIETGGSTIAPAPVEPVAAPKAVASLKKSNSATPVSGSAQSQQAQVLPDARLAQGMSAQLKSATPAGNVATGERLVLDPVDADAVSMPSLRLSTNFQGKVEGDAPSAEVKARREAAAALWLAMNSSPEQIARDRQRLQDLEQRLAVVQKQAEKARQQNQSAEGSGSESIWVYVFGGLAALFGAGLAAFVVNDRRRKSTGSDWWRSDSSSSSKDHDDRDSSPLERTLATFKPVDTLSPANFAPEPVQPTFSAGLSDKPPAEPAPTFSMSLPESSVPPQAQPAPAAPAKPIRSVFAEPAREVSVEELIDLEQQAEFFIVLGQDDAAVDLLESHVQGTTGASPLPFLKLLEIYQRLGKRPDYERVQAEFNARFNGYAPAWESDLMQGHSLFEYPGIVERLQDLWPTPSKAMGVLERSLTRPDADVETFDLPAYRELLFLYAVARDLAEREFETREAVDLNLPFAATDIMDPMPPSIEPLMATRPIKAQPQAQPMISLDLSLDDLDPLPPAAETAAPAPAPTNDIQFEHIELDPNYPGKV